MKYRFLPLWFQIFFIHTGHVVYSADMYNVAKHAISFGLKLAIY